MTEFNVIATDRTVRHVDLTRLQAHINNAHTCLLARNYTSDVNPHDFRQDLVSSASALRRIFNQGIYLLPSDEVTPVLVEAYIDTKMHERLKFERINTLDDVNVIAQRFEDLSARLKHVPDGRTREFRDVVSYIQTLQYKIPEIVALSENPQTRTQSGLHGLLFGSPSHF